jgi:hypothetical protein
MIVDAAATVCVSSAAVKTAGAMPFRQAWASAPANRTTTAVAKAATIDARDPKARSLRRCGDLQSGRMRALGQIILFEVSSNKWRRSLMQIKLWMRAYERTRPPHSRG